MSQTTLATGLALHRSASGDATPPVYVTWLGRICRRLVLGRLRRLCDGRITIVEADRHERFGRPTARCQLHSTVHVHDVRTYTHVALGGTIGFAEAYRRGFCDCDDLTALVRIALLNRTVLDGLEAGLARVSKLLLRPVHWLHRNTKAGSRRNIAAHYDLGNDFFRLMLDDTMMYSCALFERPDVTLAEASRAKNDRICRKLELSSADHVLEIGTGWGGFALHAAARYGCRVTTTTISKQQYEMAMERVRAAGMQERITVLLTDYRDLPALDLRFDKLVSIEMLEAVGHAYYERFFDVCSRMLKADGLMVLQVITIDERLYERAKRSVDFIQHVIFPGSCIPSVGALIKAAATASDLGLLQLEDIGAHYPPTLRAWRNNLASASAQVSALGYPPEFLRLWDMYFSYCEGGFWERSISNAHLLFAKPEWRPASVAP